MIDKLKPALLMASLMTPSIIATLTVPDSMCIETALASVMFTMVSTIILVSFCLSLTHKKQYK